jgi:diguanylate cyclase (GGDEF)-like protein
MKRWMGNPFQRLGLPIRLGYLVVAGYGVTAAVVVASSALGCKDACATRPMGQVVSVLCLLFATACAFKAAAGSSATRRRFGWLALTTALLGWAVGEVIWAVYEVRPALDHAVHPAAAEVVLLLYPFGAIASLLLLSNGSDHGAVQLVLDVVIVAISLFVVSWLLVVDRLVREGSSAGPVTLAHVFGDVVVITTAILVWSRARPGGRPSLNLLTGGITTIGVADIVIVFQTGVGSYHTGQLVDVTRVAGLGMLALAALAGSTEYPAVSPPDQTASRARLWLPYLPLALASGVMLGHSLRGMLHGPIPGALGILVAAVFVRQLVVLVDNQRLLSKVSREAFRDSLTGLPNRAHFLDQLEQAVAHRRLDPAPIAVMCLDLDNFKAINDALGHPAGDELLIRVAGRITAALGDTGTAARLGGDEFAVLIRGSVEESQAAAHRVLGAFGWAFVLDGVPTVVRPSIGFTLATAGPSCTVDDLLRNADLAMYAAKREGGQCIRSFVPDAPLSSALPQPTDSHVASGDHVADDRPSPEQASGPIAEDVSLPPDHPSNLPEGFTWPPLAIRIALAALAVAVTGFVIASFMQASRGQSVFLADFVYPALNLTAAALIGARAYRVSADRFAWILIAIGMASSAVGDVIYAIWVPDGQSPSAADPAYLAFYPFVYAGLLLLLRTRLGRVPLTVRLDSVICGLATAALAAALTAGPIHAAAARSPETVLVGLLYPCGDLVLAALAAGMLPILGWRNDYRWGLLIAGFLLFAGADADYLFETAHMSYRVGTLLDASWPAASLIVAMASWAPWWARTAPWKGGQRGLGPYATPVACTVVALGVAVAGHNSQLATTLAALSLIAVAARFAVTFRDVSLLADSHKRVMTDELTGLPNRRSLATALTALSPTMLPGLPLAGARSRRALLLMNLYEFQEIDEAIGRHFGDELLCHITSRLSKSVRREDLLARVGASEFAILMAGGADRISAHTQASRLLTALSEPFVLDPITVQIEARVAIALYPDHCDHPQELLNRAEQAIPYAVSANSGIVVYESAFETHRDDDPHVIDDLRTALARGDELTCHYQPKINADGSLHSVEALLRWQHPRRGLLLPEQFLPAAERAGLIRRLAYHTMSQSLAEVRSWRAQGIHATVAVNLSTTNLLDLELVGTIERLLQTNGFPARSLIIEITESTLADSARSRNTVAALQRLGVRISLDDYGTGWSSLARLQDVSVDELKLDKIFVSRLAYDLRSVAIVRSTVALARSLGADFVAEGVEDEVTLSALRRYGCTITQGFVHSPPLPADKMKKWIVDLPTHTAAAKPQQPVTTD